MTKTIARLVRRAVQEQIRQRLPWFKQVQGAEVPPGWVLYEWSVDEMLTFYVLLVLSKRFDEFTFDVAWSRKGGYPQCMPSLSVTDRVRPDEFRMRLPLLWRSPSEPEYWWSVIPKPSIHEIARQLRDPSPAPAVDDVMEVRTEQLAAEALKMLVTHAIPFFRSVASEHGVRVDIL